MTHENARSRRHSLDKDYYRTWFGGLRNRQGPAPGGYSMLRQALV